MKVLICWAGARSHQIAVALREWLPSVLQHVDPWVSSEDINKGEVWLAALLKQLETSEFGIICLVPENVEEPWIHFEAGALFRSIDTSRISPLLVRVDLGDISGPLANFQATRFDREEMRKLMHSINKSSSKPIPADRLDRTFNSCWPDLERNVSTIIASQEETEPEMDGEAMAEVLHEKQREILSFLAENPDADPVDLTIAHVIGESLTRARYHLDKLREHHFVQIVPNVAGEEVYELTRAGRAFAVEQGLI